MKSGSSPGIDRITPDHSKSTLDSSIVFHLYKLLTFCFRFGKVLPSFKKGILVPILKKPSLDPSHVKITDLLLCQLMCKLPEM